MASNEMDALKNTSTNSEVDLRNETNITTENPENPENSKNPENIENSENSENAQITTSEINEVKAETTAPALFQGKFNFFFILKFECNLNKNVKSM